MKIGALRWQHWRDHRCEMGKQRQGGVFWRSGPTQSISARENQRNAGHDTGWTQRRSNRFCRRRRIRSAWPSVEAANDNPESLRGKTIIDASNNMRGESRHALGYLRNQLLTAKPYRAFSTLGWENYKS